jgi:arsenical pump membrane protein
VDPESGLDKLDHRGELDPLPLVPLAVVVLMLAAFAATSPLGVNPAWVAVVAAVALGVHGLVHRTETPVELVQSAHLSFGLFVLCLGLVVAVLSRAWLGDLVGHLVPSNDGLVALLLLAALGAVLANAVNNLPATLLLVPLVAPLGTTAVLATLIGINVGSSLTWTGSLANLLWRRTLVRAGVRPSSRDFHLVALIASPLGILAGVCVLAGWSALIT